MGETPSKEEKEDESSEDEQDPPPRKSTRVHVKHHQESDPREKQKVDRDKRKKDRDKRKWLDRDKFQKKMESTVRTKDSPVAMSDLKFMEIPDLLAEAFGGLGLKERVALRSVSKGFRSIEECDGPYWRSMLRDEERFEWSREAKSWIESDAKMGAWMVSKGYRIDSPCMASEVFVRAPQFRAPRILYTDANWRAEAVRSTTKKWSDLRRNLGMLEPLGRGQSSIWKSGFRGFCCLVLGGWIDFKRDFAPMLEFQTQNDWDDAGISRDLCELIVYDSNDTHTYKSVLPGRFGAYSQYANLFQLLTDPKNVGSDGNRFTIGDILPRGLDFPDMVRRWHTFITNKWFAPLFCTGRVSVSGWLNRTPDEEAIWTCMYDVCWESKGDVPFEQITMNAGNADNCLVDVIAGILNRKRQIDPDPTVCMYFVGPIPRMDFSSIRAPLEWADWIADVELSGEPTGFEWEHSMGIQPAMHMWDPWVQE